MRKVLYITFFTLTVLVLIAGSALAAGETVVKLRTKATSTGRLITLDDVAVIVDPAGLIGDPLKVRLGSTPARGKTRTLTIDDVKMRMDLSGINLKKISFKGADAVVVSPLKPVATNRKVAPTRSLEENNEKLTAAAQTVLERALGKAHGRFRIDCMSVNTKYMLKADGRFTMHATPVLVPGRLDGSELVKVHVTVREHDGYTSVVPVLFKLTPLHKVAIAAFRIRKGAIITPDMIRLEEKPEGEKGFGPEEVLGKRAMVDVTEGGIFMPGMLKELPLVKRGKIVNVIVKSGKFTVMIRGRAKEDGVRGEFIEVVNFRTRKPFVAKVTGQGEVTVEGAMDRGRISAASSSRIAERKRP